METIKDYDYPTEDADADAIISLCNEGTWTQKEAKEEALHLYETGVISEIVYDRILTKIGL